VSVFHLKIVKFQNNKFPMRKNGTFFIYVRHRARKEVNEMNNYVITTAALLSLTPGFTEETKHTGPEQVSARPDIDDVICHLLDGNALKDALVFIDNIRANRMKIRWSSVNVWSVHYKRRHLCDIRLEKGS